MPHIPPCVPPAASAEAVAVYDDFYRSMGFPAAPNFILTQGHAPNVASGSRHAVKNILAEEGRIARWIKELMFVAISVDRNCAYCSAAHEPRALRPTDFQRLQSYGLDLADIMEIIGMAAFAVYANIIADATAMEPDRMFGELARAEASA